MMTIKEYYDFFKLNELETKADPTNLLGTSKLALNNASKITHFVWLNEKWFDECLKQKAMGEAKEYLNASVTLYNAAKTLRAVFPHADREFEFVERFIRLVHSTIHDMDA